MEIRLIAVRHGSRMPEYLSAVDHQSLLIGRVHLLQLHQNRAAQLTERGMARAHRIAQVGAGWIVPQLVGKGALENEDLLAAAMAVALKATPGGVTHDRSGAGHFITAAIQHPPLHPCHRVFGDD